MSMKNRLGLVTVGHDWPEQLDRIADPMGVRKMDRAMRSVADQIGDPTGMRRLQDSMRLAHEGLGGAAGQLGAGFRDPITSRHANLGAAFDLKRLVTEQRGLARFDDLLPSLASHKALLGPSLLSSIDAFKGLGDRFGLTYGTDIAKQWERFSVKSVLPELHMLSALRAGRPVALLSFFRHDDLVAQITSVEPSSEDDEGPQVEVVTVHSKPASGSQPRGERLRIDAASILQCRRCFAPFEHTLDLWLTGPNRVLYIGTIDGSLCENCSESATDDELADLLPEDPLFQLVRGHEDEAPESGVYRIVDRPAQDPPDDE